jgi:short-subunit dehydrogenase
MTDGLGAAVSLALGERGAMVLLHGRDDRRLSDTAAEIAVRAPEATVRVSALEERRSRPR